MAERSAWQALCVCMERKLIIDIFEERRKLIVINDPLSEEVTVSAEDSEDRCPVKPSTSLPAPRDSTEGQKTAWNMFETAKYVFV